MRLLVLADGEVGRSILSWLASNWLDDIAMVVTASENELGQVASSHEIPTLVFNSTEELVSVCRMRGISFDLGVLAWWPKIIGRDLLALPAHGFINTHPSLLPYNRGKHYNFWAIVEQAPFGVTLHRVNLEVDSGDIVAQRHLHYDWTDTGGTLYSMASEAMVELFKDTYPRLRSLEISGIRQPEDRGSFHLAKELDPASEIHLAGSYTGRELLNLLRARTFPPHPGCWFRDGDDEYEVRIQIEKKP